MVSENVGNYGILRIIWEIWDLGKLIFPISNVETVPSVGTKITTLQPHLCNHDRRTSINGDRRQPSLRTRQPRQPNAVVVIGIDRNLATDPRRRSDPNAKNRDPD